MANISWTEERIRAAFERFSRENGRFPTCDEMDLCSYLPTVKTLQRRFGGITSWRTKLGLEILDYRKGAQRSVMAKNIGLRGKNYERETYNILVSSFGEIYVHAQKPFDDFRGRLDFFVYTRNLNFGVDVFFPDSYRNFIKCINSKERIYAEGCDFKLFLLQMNPNISTVDIARYISKRKKPLRSNLEIIRLPEFRMVISKLLPYTDVNQ